MGVVTDVSISTNSGSYSDSTVSFSAVTCIVFHAKQCLNGAVAMTTTTSSYTTDAYLVFTRGPTNGVFGGNIYAQYVASIIRIITK